METPIQRYLWISLVLLGASSYGVLSSIIKLAYFDGWNEVQVTISQILLGTAMLWVAVLLRPKTWMNPFHGPWIKLSFVGIFGLTLTTVFINSALMTLSASLAMVLLFQFTWITIVMESMLLRKWPTRLQWSSAAVVMSGTLLAVGLSAESFQTLPISGLIYGLCSALTYSIFLTFTGRIQTRMDAVLKSAIMLTASLPVALPLMFMMFPEQVLMQSEMGALLYWGIALGLLGVVIPTIAFNLGIPRIGSSLAAILGSAELPVAIIAALLILQERVSLLQWLGIAMIIIGIIISQIKQRTIIK
jgi:drug/metabolite transporter (DMT)-like permease